MQKNIVLVFMLFLQFAVKCQELQLLQFDAVKLADCDPFSKHLPKPKLTSIVLQNNTVVLKTQLVANCGLNRKQGALQYTGDSLKLMWTENNQVINLPNVIYEQGTWFNKDSSIRISNTECDCLVELTYRIEGFKPVNNFCVRNKLLEISDSLEFLYQMPSDFTIAQWIELQLQINYEVKQLKDSLERIDAFSQGYKELVNMFALDTFKIARTLQLSLEINYSTAGMVNAVNYAHRDYEKLLNKYYGILLSNLDKADQDVLRKAQREWLKFRENEKELIYLLSQDKYSGGGTIQNILVSDSIYELTRKRTIELYQHLVNIVSY